MGKKKLRKYVVSLILEVTQAVFEAKAPLTNSSPVPTKARHRFFDSWIPRSKILTEQLNHGLARSEAG